MFVAVAPKSESKGILSGFDEEMDKLDKWSDDMKISLEKNEVKRDNFYFLHKMI